jgi:hypothetical protein
VITPTRSLSVILASLVSALHLFGAVYYSCIANDLDDPRLTQLVLVSGRVNLAHTNSIHFQQGSSLSLAVPISIT